MTPEQRIHIWLVVLGGVVAIVLLTLRLPDIILYNSSSSVPAGFYVRTQEPPLLGSFVTVRARDVAPDYALTRDFTDAGDRFIKRVAAMPGAEVCAEGSVITIDGIVRAERAEMDRAGRPLPTWSGCRTLRDEVFLLGDTPDSFDGRYWGPVPIRLIEGVWRPLL